MRVLGPALATVDMDLSHVVHFGLGGTDGDNNYRGRVGVSWRRSSWRSELDADGFVECNGRKGAVEKMIDYVSTQAGIDSQSAACARMLAAVIAKALEDLSIKPTEKEWKNGVNLQAEPTRSVRFFKGKLVPHYAALIGMDANSFMYYLTQEGKKGHRGSRFDEMDYRTIRSRLRWKLPPMGSRRVENLPPLENERGDR